MKGENQESCYDFQYLKRQFPQVLKTEMTFNYCKKKRSERKKDISLL